MHTMELLDRALGVASTSEWQRRLGLSEQALYVAKNRGHLSPSIAGALAEQLGENVDQWIVVAALESERESACKVRMLERYKLH
jgi:hypothetical protein